MECNVRQDDEQWTTVIQGRKGWFDLNLRELWQYRDLIMLFVRRDFVAVYKQTILGPFWFLLQPLVSTIVFTVVFGQIAGISTDGVPHTLFYMSGIVVWNYFAGCLTRTSDTLVANAGIFGKVYFPRLAVPISVVIVNLLTFAIQFGFYLTFFGYFYLNGASIKPNFFILTIPFLVLQMAALGLGTGILVSSLTTKYRDLGFLMGFAVQLWMFATPVVYPMSRIPENWKWVFTLNPMTSVVETFRYAFLGTGSPSWKLAIIGAAVSVLLLLLGVLLFNRMEKTFLDSV